MIHIKSFKSKRLKGCNHLFSNIDESRTAQQYYQNIKKPTQTPNYQFNIYFQEVINKSTMLLYCHQNALLIQEMHLQEQQEY